MKIIKEKIIVIFKNIISPVFWKDSLIKLKTNFPKIIKIITLFIGFFILLIFFLFSKVIDLLNRFKYTAFIIKKITPIWDKRLKKLHEIIVEKIEKSRSSEVKRSYLITLGYKNLMTKKVRTLITILGMSLGVGVIVLLLSLGYGIEKMVIGKVASLDELRMIDVSSSENTALRLNRQIVEKIEKLKDVEKLLPMVSVVGRVNYNKAITDVLVYAVSRSYLDSNKTKLVKGKLFTSNSIFPKTKASESLETGEVAGIETQMPSGQLNSKISENQVYFNINPETAAIAWKDCNISSEILGYTSRIEGGLRGDEIWGGDYYPFTNKGREGYDEKRKVFLGKWIKANVALFEKTKDETLIPKLDEYGRQKWETVCLQEKNLQIIGDTLKFADVLGEATESATYDTSVVATDSSGMEFVTLEASGSAAKTTTKTLAFETPPEEQAVVSAGFLSLLNIPVDKSIGKDFKVSFIIVKSLMPEIDGKVLTSEVNYKIIGVTDDTDSAYFYIPFADIYKLSIKNFSQLKVVLSKKESLPGVRKEIETFGFRTASTVDTVSQIESLFANLRILLGLLGLVALGVASLGMFNTLTVSLLERTREIGGMKAMGMVSSEVQDLFLAEAMTMGLSSGIGGLILGISVGKLISFLISVFAITKGQGYLDLTYTPPIFIIFILLSSFVVGALTGLYPAQRAKKISALNALRYE